MKSLWLQLSWSFSSSIWARRALWSHQIRVEAPSLFSRDNFFSTLPATRSSIPDNSTRIRILFWMGWSLRPHADLYLGWKAPLACSWWAPRTAKEKFLLFWEKKLFLGFVARVEGLGNAAWVKRWTGQNDFKVVFGWVRNCCYCG